MILSSLLPHSSDYRLLRALLNSPAKPQEGRTCDRDANGNAAKPRAGTHHSGHHSSPPEGRSTASRRPPRPPRHRSNPTLRRIARRVAEPVQLLASVMLIAEPEEQFATILLPNSVAEGERGRVERATDTRANARKTGLSDTGRTGATQRLKWDFDKCYIRSHCRVLRQPGSCRHRDP